MKRIQLFATSLAVISLALTTSCSLFKKRGDVQGTEPAPTEFGAAATDLVPAAGDPAVVSVPDQALAQSPPPAGATPAAELQKDGVTPAPLSKAEAVPTGETTQDYTVKSGDTLMKIAFEQYGDLFKWESIWTLNRDRLKNGNNITPGQTLTIYRPENVPHLEHRGEAYLVKQGDTLGTISSEVYGTPSKWRRIYENNASVIKDPNRIFAGFYLYYVPEKGREMASDSSANPSGASAPAPMARSATPAVAPPAPTAPPAAQIALPQANSPAIGAPIGQ